MDELYGWVKNITYFLIFMTVITNLLPNKKYEKYIKLFAGMVLVLLVMKPLTGSLNLDQKIAYYFESYSFQKEVDELGIQLLGMEGKRIGNIISQYQEQVGDDITSMAERSGYLVSNVEVAIDREDSSQTFGHIVAVTMTVASGNDAQAGSEKTVIEAGIDPIEAVEVVEQIEIGGVREEKASLNQEKQKESPDLLTLRHKIAEYYDMEENDIEIRLEEDGER